MRKHNVPRPAPSLYDQLKQQYPAWVQLHFLYHILVKKDEGAGPEIKDCDCEIAEAFERARI